MAGERLSMQQLIARRRRTGFVGRRDELTAFRANLGTDPEDEAHRFLFHVHGAAGVGKSTLLRQLEHTAREHRALTAYVDETAATVPDTMAAISARLGEQGHPLKAFDKLVGVYRQRLHEAETSAVGVEPQPSAGSSIVAQVGLAGFGLLPGAGALAGALDPGQLAQGADRLRAVLSARFRNEQDVQLVLEPLSVLTPVFAADLASVAADAPWLTLFFDTYEVTGPRLDGWLRDLLLDGRYGALPANVVITLAGQSALDPATWSDHLDFVADLPLDAFTDTEARQLLADRGITDEAVVEVILRLSGRLPLLVSTLAESRPSGPDAVGDPSDTAVERFLKWERDPVRRAAAIAAALPLRLDEDVYRVAVADDAPQAAELYDWLRALAFVQERAGHARYHGVVRAAMLRMRRTRSPQRWREQHERLAAAFRRWRERVEDGRGLDQLWADGEWRAHRLNESYHELCADPRGALPGTLLHIGRACTASAGHQWMRMLDDAGADAGSAEVARWAADIADALAPAGGDGSGDVDGAGGSGPVRVLTLILDAGGLDRDRRATAHAIRAWTHRQNGDPAAALADYDRAAALGLDTFVLYEERGNTRWTANRLAEAGEDYERALARAPGERAAQSVRTNLGGVLLRTGRLDEALTELTAVIDADPDETRARAYRAMVLLQLNRPQDALPDAEECVTADPASDDHAGLRGLIRQRLGHNAAALADLDRALSLQPDSDAWVFTGRGLALEGLGRFGEAADSFARAVAREGADRTDPETLAYLARLHRLAGRHDEALTVTALARDRDPRAPGPVRERALTLYEAGRLPEAAEAFGRLLDLEPAADYALISRALIQVRIGRPAAALADLDRLARLGPPPPWFHYRRAQLMLLVGDEAGALADLAAAERSGPLGRDALMTLAVCHREGGRYAAAAAALERAAGLAPGVQDAGIGMEAALLATLTGGAAAARPRWLALRVAGAPPGTLAAESPGLWRTVVSCGLEEWADADTHVTALLAGRPTWEVLAIVARDLAAFTRAPGADGGALAPLLTRVTEARSASEP